MGWRQVVTTDDPAGRGRVTEDRVVDALDGVTAAEGVEVCVMWVTDTAPPAIDAGDDRSHPAWTLGPLPSGGARWSLITFQPGARARGMHRTETVDLVQVVSGEIDLVTSGGDERHLRAGDTVVQRGAEHAWHNRSGALCVLSTVMFDARR